ncbi:MAG: YceI family protein [Ignavibacteria bacterium]|nr:YceI family protein [Ignavibacteria bacterium]
MKKFLVVFLVLAMSSFASTVNNYSFDKNHARLSFSVMHFGISHVEGIFKSFTATMNSSKEDFTDADIEMNADVNSINTEVEMRDKDLRGENWFNADKYPTINFKSTSFKKTAGGNYELAGNFTMCGVTNPIVFNAVYNGKAENPFYKTTSVGFTITGKLNRTDYKLGGAPMATGVGDEIELKSNVEFYVK